MGSAYDGLRIASQYSVQYNVIQMVRRLLTVGIVIGLKDYPFAQIQLIVL